MPSAFSVKTEVAPDSRAAGWWSLLRAVSRSFYLSIRFLPKRIRPTIALGYLIARATDTIADTSRLPTDRRLAALDGVAASLKAVAPELVAALPECAGAQARPEETALLLQTKNLLEAVHARPAPHRRLLQEVLEKIIRGQRLDLIRFHGAIPGPPLSKEQLDEYTYLVAGSVGEFWTALCLQEWAGYARTPPARLLELGIHFGKGLQLINILRDFPEDLQAGRCYLPLAETIARRRHLASAMPVFRQTARQTRLYLEDAWRYTTALRPMRVRFACALPVLIGLRTLQRLERAPTVPAGVKIHRSEVRRLIGWSLLVAIVPQSASWCFQRVLQ